MAPERAAPACRLQLKSYQLTDIDDEFEDQIDDTEVCDQQQQPEGLSQLGKLSAAFGLANSDIRARMWPCLTGMSTDAAAEGSPSTCPAATAAQAAYEAAAHGSHRDSSTVCCDVERSLWHLVPDDAERGERREALARLLNALVVGSGGDVHYYQGLHDVASILLLVVGEQRAHAMLQRLATCHLRNATRPNMHPVMDLLQLLQPILEVAAPQLASSVVQLGLLPNFALSWLTTWFSHGLHDMGECARLFDLFLASHPLMPLYVGAVAMRSQAKALLACEEMGELHHALQRLEITKAISVENLVRKALKLFDKCPPAAALARHGRPLYHAVAHLAFIHNGEWKVPALPGQDFGQQLRQAARSLEVAVQCGRLVVRRPQHRRGRGEGLNQQRGQQGDGLIASAFHSAVAEARQQLGMGQHSMGMQQRQQDEAATLPFAREGDCKLQGPGGSGFSTTAAGMLHGSVAWGLQCVSAALPAWCCEQLLPVGVRQQQQQQQLLPFEARQQQQLQQGEARVQVGRLRRCLDESQQGDAQCVVEVRRRERSVVQVPQLRNGQLPDRQLVLEEVQLPSGQVLEERLVGVRQQEEQAQQAELKQQGQQEQQMEVAQPAVLEHQGEQEQREAGQPHKEGCGKRVLKALGKRMAGMVSRRPGRRMFALAVVGACLLRR